MVDDQQRSLFGPQQKVLGTIKYHYNGAIFDSAFGDGPTSIQTKLKIVLYGSVFWVFWGEVNVPENWNIALAFVDMADVLLDEDDVI